ncbi:MAG: hypothetical protein GEV03_17165 [Streptosporangiales bacterium]|nr:hypothetical protein [Streptosporangiales bacterium]
MTTEKRGKVDCTGVEWGSVEWTMLCTLYLRAYESRSMHSILADHAAAEAVDRIDYDFDRMKKYVKPSSNQVRLHALEALCAHHRASGRLDTALQAGLAAVACEPLRESAHRQLARVHLAEGNPSEALRQYDLYRRLLRTELGLAPSPKFRQLVAPLLGRPLDAPSA